jgi:hypothetical protein
LEITEGGISYQPGDLNSLVSALERVLCDAGYAWELGRKGRAVVFEKFNVEETARSLVRICEGAVQGFRRR